MTFYQTVFYSFHSCDGVDSALSEGNENIEWKETRQSEQEFSSLLFLLCSTLHSKELPKKKK